MYQHSMVTSLIMIILTLANSPSHSPFRREGNESTCIPGIISSEFLWRNTYMGTFWICLNDRFVQGCSISSRKSSNIPGHIQDMGMADNTNCWHPLLATLTHVSAILIRSTSPIRHLEIWNTCQRNFLMFSDMCHVTNNLKWKRNMGCI